MLHWIQVRVVGICCGVAVPACMHGHNTIELHTVTVREQVWYMRSACHTVGRDGNGLLRAWPAAPHVKTTHVVPLRQRVGPFWGKRNATGR